MLVIAFTLIRDERDNANNDLCPQKSILRRERKNRCGTSKLISYFCCCFICPLDFCDKNFTIKTYFVEAEGRCHHRDKNFGFFFGTLHKQQ